MGITMSEDEYPQGLTQDEVAQVHQIVAEVEQLKTEAEPPQDAA